jgi:hypothetical protein
LLTISINGEDCFFENCSSTVPSTVLQIGGLFANHFHKRLAMLGAHNVDVVRQCKQCRQCRNHCQNLAIGNRGPGGAAKRGSPPRPRQWSAAGYRLNNRVE